MIGESAQMLARRTLPVLQFISQQVDPVARDVGAPCGSCSTPHCCYTVVPVTLADAAVVVNYLMTEKPTEIAAVEATARLHSDAMQCYETAEAWRAARVPCVFLRDVRCTVYDVRPVICRTHYVLSEPAACEAGPVRKLMLNGYDLAALNMASQECKVVGVGYMRGPMADMLLLALDWFRRGDEALADGWEKAKAALHHAESMMAS